MELKIIDGEFSICQIKDMSKVNFEDEFVFFSKTDDELSLVCREEYVPADHVIVDSGFSVFRMAGVLDFSLIGILSRISTILAAEKISIFAVSTYNTDYIFVKTAQLEKAKKALQQNGYTLI